MSTKTLHVKLEGKAQLHQPVIRLEEIEVNIWSIDGGITWENKNVVLDITGTLEVYMSCKAMTGTDWDFFVQEKNSIVKCYETEGTTGEPLDSRNGTRIPNFSERKDSVNC